MFSPPAHADWSRPSVSDHFTPIYNEGLATDRHGFLHPRGWLSIRPELAAQGWTHIGDQDIHGGYTYDVYEDLDAGRKLFTITSPTGRFTRYDHVLEPGERANNSFVTVDPTGEHLVNGEWFVMKRLLVFDNPKGEPSGSTIPIAGEIRLDKPLENVQSCDFVTAERLACAVDEPVNRVVSVTLSAPVGSAKVVDATVTPEFDLPKRSVCTGTYESEGIDYDTRRRVLSVAMINPSPCFVGTKVFRYRAK
ncbi:hypothetical protein nbrc107696_34920 [Gordonia spumicola]|uniref:Uncharacterized protein n=1 Tax=Gordonia spumicola TaxID=589161 RepID=A0A7I9VCF0_9ACTN|nr:hypothetical protein nbrc107696_34920 [Gordonia spumicola]